jgi:hypothetical protein
MMCEVRHKENRIQVNQTSKMEMPERSRLIYIEEKNLLV